MADSKITALTALTSADPANDMIPIVDVSDTPPASGNTKRISINNILAASGTATLASATITGDLTVDTNVLKVDSANNRVGIGTASPALPLDVVGGIQVTSGSAGGLYQLAYGASASSRSWRAWNDVSANGDFQISTSTTRTGSTYSDRYRIDVTGIHEWFNTSGTAMTLNSTGLGVGVVPGSAIGNLQVGGSANGNLYTQQGTDTVRMGMRATGRTGILFDSSDATYTNRAWYLDNVGSTGSLIIGRQGLDVITFDNVGNVGIGVTPSAWQTGTPAVQLKYNSSIWSNSDNTIQINQNAYFDGSSWKYVNATSLQASNYFQYNGSHIWRTAGAGTAGNAITWTTPMTLDASGNLILLSPSTPPTLATNGQLTVNATSNTNLRFSYRGSDGVTRVANLTLA